MSKITLVKASDIGLDKLVASDANVRRIKAGVPVDPADLWSWPFAQDESVRAELFALCMGLGDTVVDRLKAQGLVSEIIAWKLRLFVPLGEEAAKIVEKLLALYPLLRVAPATRVNS